METHTLPADSTAADERAILFVGDIQGCSRELELLLDQAGFVPGRHRLIPLGDTINRGPDAARTLALLRQAEAEPILGNHECALLELAQATPAPEHAQRPQSAYAQLLQAGQLQPALEWISSWPLYRSGGDWLAVHAGLHPLHAPEATDPAFLTNVRYCDANGHVPPESERNSKAAPAGFRPWHAFYQGQRTVMFGHWARQGLLIGTRLRGLDTGCVYGGRLTGLWWPEDRLVQVPVAS